MKKALPKYHPMTGEPLYTPDEFKKICISDIEEISTVFYWKLEEEKSKQKSVCFI